MKLRALANISGGAGERVIGEEFEASAALAKVLIEEGWAEDVKASKTEAKTKQPSDTDAAGQ